MRLKNNAGGWLLSKGRRTKDLDCLSGTVTGQVTSSLTCNNKRTLQIHCCQPPCPFLFAVKSQTPTTSSFPSPRPCPAHGAPVQLLCNISPHRGRTGKRRCQPSAKVNAVKEGSVSSIRSAQPAKCFCNPFAPGRCTVLPVCWMLLYEQHPLHPVRMVLQAAASRKGDGEKHKEEAADPGNFPALFPALSFSVLVGNMDSEMDLTATEVQKPTFGTP